MRFISILLTLSMFFISCGHDRKEKSSDGSQPQTSNQSPVQDETPPAAPQQPAPSPQDSSSPGNEQNSWTTPSPSIELSFSLDFELGNESQNLWRFDLARRHEFYNQGIFKIKKFSVTNISDRPIVIRFNSIDAAGSIHQYLAQVEWQRYDRHARPLFSCLRQKMELALPTFIEFYLANGNPADPIEGVVLDPGQMVIGFLKCNFSRLTQRQIPEPWAGNDDYIQMRTIWGLYRIAFNFRFAFAIEGSYLSPRNWQPIFTYPEEEVVHQVDRALENLSAQTIHSLGRETIIGAFSQHGLY